MKDILDKLDNILNEGHLGELADRVELDHEVQMARADLYKIAKYAIKLHDMMKNVSEVQGIEGWQQSKITKAADYLGSVYHNLDYEMSPMNPMNDEGQMAQMAFDIATEDKIVEKGYTDAERKAMDDAVAAANDPASGERTTGNPADGVGAAAAKANAGAAAAATDPASGERTTGNPADGIGAAAAAANNGRIKRPRPRGKTNESKFSDWGKK